VSAGRDDTVQLLHALGYLYGCHGQARRGVVLLLIAARLAPEDSGVLKTLAHLFVIDGEADRALTVIARLEALDGDGHPALALLKSRALLAAGRTGEARDVFRDFQARRGEA